eukprot:gene10640-22207_t
MAIIKSDVSEATINGIFPPFVLYCLALFILYPTAAQVTIQLVCEETVQDSNCSSAVVSSKASMVMLYTSLVGSIPAILLSGLYGSIADRYGRKFAMLCPFIGLLLYAMCYCYVATLKPSYYVFVILLGSLFMGLSGSIGSFLTGVFSYASDITINTPNYRSHSYSLVEACLYLAKIIGPLSAGIWASKFESLPKDAICRQNTIKLDVFKTFSNIKLFFTFIPIKGLSPLPWLISAFFSYFIGAMGESAIFYLYMKHMYSWGPATIGYYIAVEAVLQMICMLILPYVILYIFQVELSDIVWIQFGFLARTIYWFLFGNMHFSSSGYEIFLLLPLLGICGPVSPRMRSILSNSVPNSYQARIFSAFSAVESIGSILSHVFNIGYSHTVHSNPSLMFSIFSILGVIASIILLYIRLDPNIYSNLPHSELEKNTGNLSGESSRGLYSNTMFDDSNNSGGIDTGTFKTDKQLFLSINPIKSPSNPQQPEAVNVNRSGLFYFCRTHFQHHFRLSNLQNRMRKNSTSRETMSQYLELIDIMIAL